MSGMTPSLVGSAARRNLDGRGMLDKAEEIADLPAFPVMRLEDNHLRWQAECRIIRSPVEPAKPIQGANRQYCFPSRTAGKMPNRSPGGEFALNILSMSTRTDRLLP
jgi:hypothetical protein